MPHGEHVHALGCGQLLIGVAFQVVDGDGQVPTAVVTLPGAKFLRSFDVGDLGSVRRERSQVTAGNRQHLRRASLRRHQEEFREAAWRRAEAVRAEENVFAVGRPAKNDVVRWMRRQAPGLAAFRRNDINIRVAIVLAGEGDPFAVGRKLWVELVADMRGEPPRRAALARGDPQVARVSKNHSVLGNVPVPEKLRRPRRNFLGGLCRRLRRQRRKP